MSRFIAASRSPDRNAQTPADAALWAELYFPRVEDLLRRLAISEKRKRYSLHALLFGSWPITTGFIIGLICIPGCATGAILLMAAGHLDLPLAQTEEQAYAKADRPAQVESSVRSPSSFVEITPALAFSDEQTDLPGGIALRGTLLSAALTASIPAQPARTLPAKPARRSAAKPISFKPAAEHPEPAPQPVSLLEKLFNLIVPASQTSQQPAQRQT
jgi:hypothetical protein